jgi:hypothetical protein
MSCPHACITGVDCPPAFRTTTVLANGKPVFSSTGSASSSVRSMTVGPGPFFMTATTPAADAGRDVEAEGFRARGQFRRGLRFLKRQLRMLMKIDASASMSG